MLESIRSIQSRTLVDEDATMAFGKELAQKKMRSSGNLALIVFLKGDLAAGKTTLVRGFLQGMGHIGNVKSPTYTLVEAYELKNLFIYHFDLYRLSDPEELEFMGIRDYFTDHSIVLIEWPERGEGFLPMADLILTLKIIPEGRLLTIQTLTERGLIL